MSRYQRCDVFGYRIERVVGIGFGDVEKYERYAVQKVAAVFVGQYRVFKCRGIGVSDNRIDVGIVLLHAFLERRYIMFVFYLVERRHSVWSVVRREKRIRHFVCFSAAGGQKRHGGGCY